MKGGNGNWLDPIGEKKKLLSIFIVLYLGLICGKFAIGDMKQELGAVQYNTTTI